MRTGAIFARGSCRALKWMALVGVVFGLGVSSAFAQQPPPPTDFRVGPAIVAGTANTTTQGTMRLSWTRSTNSATLLGHQWRAVGVDAGNGVGAWSSLVDSSVEYATTPLLTAGSRYTFELQAVHLDDDDDDTDRELSVIVYAQGVAIGIPPDVTDLEAKQGNRMVTLTWKGPGDPPAQPVTGFRYRYGADDDTDDSIDDGQASSWASTGSSSVVVEGLVNGKQYVFEVRARNPAGESEILRVSEVPSTTPSEPQLLNLNNNTAGRVVVSWNAPADDGGDDIDRYEYRYQEDGDADWITWSSTGTDRTVTVSSLLSQRVYNFEVRAQNENGPGKEAKGSVRVTGPDRIPSAPGKPTATPGNGTATLTWTAPLSNGGEGITSYEYEKSDDAGNWHEFPNLSLTQTVSGLRNGQEYTFRVRAVNEIGKGEPSMASDPVRPGATAPGAPRNLVASASNDGSRTVLLTWDAPLSDGGASITGYHYKIDDDWVPFSWLDNRDENGRQIHRIYNLTNGQTYTFHVRAVNSLGEGPASNAATATPTAPVVPDVPIMVKSVTAATSVDESGGLDVTVTAVVPAGTKGADEKVAPVASQAVYVTFEVDNPAIANHDEAEPEDTTLLGATSGNMYTWRDVPRTDKESEQTFKFRVAIGQDLDAEDEEFEIEVTMDGAGKRSKVVTILDAQEQKFSLTLESDEEEKNTIKEGGSGTLKLKADPAKTSSLSVELVLNPNDPSKYTLSRSRATLAAKGTVEATVNAKADDNRKDDTITVAAYTSGTLGNDVMIAEIEITVADASALPAVEAMVVDDKGKALDPQPDSVTEGETVKVMLTVVDEDGKDMEAPEKLSVSLMPSSGSSADYRLSTHPIVIEKGKKSSASVDLMLTMDDDIGMEMLVFDASVAGDAKIGSETRAVNGVLSLTVEDGTQKLVYAKTQEEVEAAIYAAKEVGAGDDMKFTPGEMIEVMGNDLFSTAEGVTLTYTAESDMSAVASTSVGGGMVMVTAVGEGMAHITITAHASMPSGVKILDQTDPGMASVVFPVEVGLEALSIMLSGPEDMNVAEGMSAMVTATANRAATEDVTVMLMRDREMSSAGDADFMAEPIVIEAGEMMGSTMVMAVEDNMMEDMEELVLYGMTEGMAGEVTGEVKFYLWDAAVPALPVIAQLLLAAFLAVGGYRRYRRR